MCLRKQGPRPEGGVTYLRGKAINLEIANGVFLRRLRASRPNSQSFWEELEAPITRKGDSGSSGAREDGWCACESHHSVE
jgi:hypothetical protein